MAKSLDLDSKSREPNADVKFWLDEISAARKREKDFRATGKRILEIYDGEKAKTTPYNILFSNTETMLPALYSAVPRPVVQRRFKDEDPMGKQASVAAVRGLEFLLDTNVEGYETFDMGMKAVALDALLPGRGWANVKYDAAMGEYPAKKEGEQPSPYTESELVCVESRQWDRVYHGYAKRWHKVPWIAYEDYIDKEEATAKFGAEKAAKLTYSETDDHADKDEPRSKDERSRGERKVACLYQIWDKEGWGNKGKKKILYVSPQYKDGYLKEDDDELQLTGFFNCPKPLQFLEKTHSLTPTALYVIYENQAKELNKIQQRINGLVAACKARGLYDGELAGDLSKLFGADENELIPTEKGSSLAAEKGLGNAIWFMPLDQIRQVLMDLYNAREQCKQVIYEITGISDILRGSSKASETLGAQEIKTQWGTLRLKNKQKEVARYARDLLRMMLELAASKFSEETWAKMTGLPFLLEPKFNELTTLQQTLKQAVAQEQALMGQQMPPQQPGQPPQQPPPSPNMQQLQQVEQQLQTPKWADVLALLQNDLQRAYRIDIETNSTVEPEASEDHKNIQELLTAIGQYLQGVGPLVINGSMPFQVARSMMLTICRRFRFGHEIEDDLKQMQAPKPPDDGKGAEAVQKEKEMAAKELDMQKKQAENDLKMRGMDEEMKGKQREMDLQMREAQLAVDQEVFKMKQQAAQDQLALRDQAFQVKAGAEEKVRSVKDLASKKEAQAAQGAKNDLSGSVAAIQKTTQQVQQLSQSLTQMQQQAEQTQALLAELLKAATAKRVKRAIRGKDNRIERVEEEIAV